MGTIEYTTVPGIPRSTQDQDFLTHKKNSEWWYATGYLATPEGRLFGFQFTVAHLNVKGIKIHILLTSLTDYASGKHYYEQSPIFFNQGVVTTDTLVSAGTNAWMTFMPNEQGSKGHMTLRMRGAGWDLAVDMEAKKPAAWHCDGGELKMGIVDDPKQKTFYYSYTNMAATGVITVGGETFEVAGKGWFDKQGGPYTATDRRCNWEWFSLRFFDEEEMMLFTFPQTNNYHDGTYIAKDGQYSRLKDFTIKPLGFTQAAGKKFSNGWQVSVGDVKEGEYTLTPVMDGQFNLFFFELLAEIRNPKGEHVGYAVVELMPGVYNEKTSILDAFKRV